MNYNAVCSKLCETTERVTEREGGERVESLFRHEENNITMQHFVAGCHKTHLAGHPFNAILTVCIFNIDKFHSQIVDLPAVSAKKQK